MEKWLKDVLPVMGVENDCILSKMGDVTVVYECTLPEIFTLSDREYEAFHQAWIKAIKILPRQLVFHKQDWFVESQYQADFSKAGSSFLSRSSERFFNERPLLDHHCYILLTSKPLNRKASSSLFSTLLRSSVVPEETLKPQLLQDFLDGCGQFKRILEDSGVVQLKRLTNDELQSQADCAGLIERYCFLAEPGEERVIKDIVYKDGINHHLFAQTDSATVLKLQVSCNKTTSIVFPQMIKSIDRGTKDLLVQRIDGAENVLQEKAAKENFTATSLTVITAGGRLWSFYVQFAVEPNRLMIQLDNLRNVFQQIAAQKRTVHGVRDESYEMIVRLKGLFVQNDIFYYQLELENKSNISYDIDLLRFYTKDKKQSKRTASQELEQVPISLYGNTQTSRHKPNKLLSRPCQSVPFLIRNIFILI